MSARLGAGLPVGTPVTVASLGDSITRGAGSSAGLPCKSAGWRYVLQTLAAAQGITIAMVGANVTGNDSDVPQRCHDGTDGDAILAMQARCLLRAGQCSEVMIIMGGANDVMQAPSTGDTGATIAARMSTLLGIAWDINQRSVSSVNRTKLIEVIQIPYVYVGTSVALLYQIVDDYNALLPGICAAHRALGRNVLHVNGNTPLGPNPGPSFNPLSNPHPGDVGYPLLAAAMLGTPGSGLLIDYTR